MRGTCIFFCGWVVLLAAMNSIFGSLPPVAGISLIVGAWLAIVACLLAKP